MASTVVLLVLFASFTIISVFGSVCGVAVTWGVDVPVPPVPTAGLFAATSQGLISLNLQTLEAKILTPEYTLAVAVNHNLGKVYWSENYGNQSIMRSNFDGSAKELIVPGKGDRYFMLAIEESSGNIYFGRYESHEITVCNAIGKNCTVIISNSNLVTYPSGILLDSKNGVMYWGKRGSPCALVRANLDGSNATIISTKFTNLRGITLAQSTSDTIYYADYTDNTIGTFGISSGDKRTLIELENNPGPFGIQADAHKVYFSNHNSGTVQSFSKDSHRELTTIFKSTGYVRYLAIFNAPAL